MNRHQTLFVSLCSLCLFSCGGGSASSLPSLALSNESKPFDYPLVDSPEYGRAIYPDEALQKLHHIQSHNLEHGVEWPSGPGCSESLMLLIEGEKITNYDNEQETYVPGEYYFFHNDSYFLNVDAIGFFEADGEFFRGVYGDPDFPRPYYSPSTREEMAFHFADKSHRSSHYDAFLSIVDTIEERELKVLPVPEDIVCYSSGEGSLYINIYHQFDNPYGLDRRYICRIIYENYVPVYAIYQSIRDIMGDPDYYDESHVARFTFGEVEVRDDLTFYFGERRDS